MLGENIKNLRTSLKLTQVEIANKLGVTKQCVSNWENDNIVPSVDMLTKIAQIFKVSTDYLLDISTINMINVDGLTQDEIAHIKIIIEDIKKHKQSC